MKTCGTCQHFTRKGAVIDGMGLCTQEDRLHRMARHFSPAAPCNKGKHLPATTPKG